MNSVFIDSNIIIKYFVGDAQARNILKPVIYGEMRGFINNIVFSEVLFITIKLLTGLKAYELRKNLETIQETLEIINENIRFLRDYFIELEINDEVKELALEIMKEHGLLPNDALIAATCRYYKINTLATFDEDFKRVPWLKVIP